ncbi:MAG: hypothetical protein ACTSYI_04685 [Promethearchaeota archaeon]
MELEKPEQDYVTVVYFCDQCKKRHKVNILKDIFEDADFPLSYSHFHGDPIVNVTLYIDANYKVRGVEYPKGSNMQQNELDSILNSSKSQSLKSIPTDQIYAFEFSEEKKIKKYYNRPGYEKTFNFTYIRKLIKYSTKFMKTKEECNEFFLKYNDYWIAGLEMFDNSLMMVIDQSIDVDHLKTQVMTIFESLCG